MGGGPSGFAQRNVETFVDPYRLFRFVDLTVEPGKTYRYQVKILLYNPNYDLTSECLDQNAIQAGTSKKRLIESKAIETPPITVPHTFQVLADSVNAGRLSDVKARVNLLALAKTPVAESQSGGESDEEKNTYVEILKEVEVPLGGIVYLPNQSVDKVVDMRSESVRKVDNISVDTDQTTILDVRNDKPLGEGKSRDATEMLMMDGSGRLFNASRAADRMVVADYEERTKPQDESKETISPTPKPTPGGINTRPPTAGPPKGGSKGGPPGSKGAK